MGVRPGLVKSFMERFASEPDLVVRAPGRVNLIGEHTDYNDGFVLPMAIDRSIWVGLQPRSDQRVILHALDLDSVTVFSLKALERGDAGWAEYMKGVAWSLQEAGHILIGWEGVLAGDVPRGAGLSSSAALELATARAFAAISGLAWDGVEMAKLCQLAENEWVGVQCGIMDQMTSAIGRAGHAMMIDCRSLEAEAVPLPQDSVVVVLDTGTRRGLVDSVYNQRREECEAAARFLGVQALRDVSAEELEGRRECLGPVLRRRARHVVTENARTLRAAEAMRRGDASELGRLMNASHVSLRDDFEVSSQELDAMVGCARQAKGSYGARMTGAGFGGCAVALVRQAAATQFIEQVTACYRRTTSREAQAYVCEAADGAGVVFS